MNSAPHFHLSAAAAASEGLESDEGLPPRSKRLKLTHAANEVASPFPFPFLAANDVINIEPPLYPAPPSPPQNCYVCYKTFTSSEALHRHMRRHHPSPTWPGEAPPSPPPGAERDDTDPLLHLYWTQSNARRFIFPSRQELDGDRASHKGQEDREYGPKHN